MRERIEAALEKLKPALHGDGGDIELLDIKDGTVRVLVAGACAGCPMCPIPIEEVVERIIRQEAPEIKEVVIVI
ncbi:MAG: NifU family protein [Chloroflexi bacterium]|nr:NifU family protein [Chloroflexota bacterium]